MIDSRAQNPLGKPAWLFNSHFDESFFRPSREIIFPQFNNLQVRVIQT